MVPLAVAVALLAGCPDDKDLMWCLKLKSNSNFVVDAAGNPVALRANRAMIEYGRRLKGH